MLRTLPRLVRGLPRMPTNSPATFPRARAAGPGVGAMDRYQRVPVQREPEEHAENEVAGAAGGGVERGGWHASSQEEQLLPLLLKNTGCLGTALRPVYPV